MHPLTEKIKGTNDDLTISNSLWNLEQQFISTYTQLFNRIMLVSFFFFQNEIGEFLLTYFSLSNSLNDYLSFVFRKGNADKKFILQERLLIKCFFPFIFRRETLTRIEMLFYILLIISKKIILNRNNDN